VNKGIPHPPSLQNIFKELHAELGMTYPKSGNLSPWAAQGVLLLNATLTVRSGEAGSHHLARVRLGLAEVCRPRKL